jgi:hypothetical protein
MQAAGLLVLGAFLDFTYADVVCKTKKLLAKEALPRSRGAAKDLRD